MRIFDDNRFMKLENGKIVKGKVLYLKHSAWIDPDNKERGRGGVDAVARVIENHAREQKKLGYEIEYMFDHDLTTENSKKYDFIHCSFWYQCYRCIALGVPYILNFHDNAPLLEPKGTDFYNVYAKSIKNSIVTVAQTDQIKEKWNEYSDKILTVPVPIDTDLLTIDSSIEREDFVLSVGIIEEIKGHRYLARACNELGLKLLVIGNPREGSEIDALKHEIGHSNGNIEWIDQSIAFEDLIEYYRKCRVFALATKMDIPGLVFLEALSCGSNVVATMEGDYKSENPKITRCEVNVESIKNALSVAWDMPNDSSGREYVVSKHHPKKTAEDYVKNVYDKKWKKEYNIMDKTSSFYEIFVNDNSDLELSIYNRPLGFKKDIQYEFEVQKDNNIIWKDIDFFENELSIRSKYSSANLIKDFEIFSYSLKINDILFETGIGNNEYDFDRTFHIESLDFLLAENVEDVLFTDRGHTSSQSNDDEGIIKYLDYRIRGKNWDLYVNPIEKNGVSLELFSWPLVNEYFCTELIEKAESYGKWTTDRHHNYPTHDILLENIGYDKIWDRILLEYAHPVASLVWGLEGYKDKMKNESFIAKYDLESDNHQIDLGCHHDASDYTFIVSLNRDFEGGGTWFPRQNYLIDKPIGEVVVHPTITHKHGARAVTSGTRYVLITFCNKI